VLLDEAHGHRALPHRRRESLDRARPHVAGGEDATITIVAEGDELVVRWHNVEAEAEEPPVEAEPVAVS